MWERSAGARRRFSWANSTQSHRPSVMPTGSPTMRPASPITVACTATGTEIWPPVNPSDFKSARSRRRRRTDATRVRPDRDDRRGGQASGQQGRCGPHRAVVHDLGWQKVRGDEDRVARTVAIGRPGEGLVAGKGDPPDIGPGGSFTQALVHLDEDEFRTIEGGVGARLQGLAERGGNNSDRHERAGAHGGVVALGAGKADGRHGGGANDVEDRGRHVVTGAQLASVGDGDGSTDVGVKVFHGGRAENDLVVALKAVPREDCGLHPGAGPFEEGGDDLPVDLRVSDRHVGVRGHLGVVVQQRDRLWGTSGPLSENRA